MSDVQLLSARQLSGLLRIGDALVPGDDVFPSFSGSQCAAEADRLLMYLPQADRDRLRRLLGVARVLPRAVLRWLFGVAERHAVFPAPLARALRMLHLSAKGVVMSLYYSDVGQGPSRHALLDWPRTTVPDEAASVAAGATTRARSLPPAARAFAQAHAATASLARLSLAERAARLGALRELVLARREAIVDHIQDDTGKTRADALVGEVFGVLETLRWLEHHGAASLRERRALPPTARRGKQSWIWYEPLGTVLIIASWQDPFAQALVPIASAFLAGNTVVYKPSEWTPLDGLIEGLLADADFAPHWVQIVRGHGRTGAALIAERPDKIFFTGTTRTGRKVLTQASEAMIPVALALGGNDPMLVFDDADVGRAAAGAAWGALTNAGQSCTSVERLYVQAPIYDAFRAALVGEVERLTQGIDTDGDADVGAMTTDFQVRTVADHVADARAKGADVITGGDWNGTSKLVPPMVVDGVTDAMLLAREETCGPVLPLLRFETEDEVVQRVNDGAYGLSASVWSRDRARARRVAGRLDCGSVSINDVRATGADPALPIGGRKRSGVGRIQGVEGLHAFCNVKSVSIDEGSSRSEPHWYPYTREKYALVSEAMAGLFARQPRAARRARRTLERQARRVPGKGG